MFNGPLWNVSWQHWLSELICAVRLWKGFLKEIKLNQTTRTLTDGSGNVLDVGEETSQQTERLTSRTAVATSTSADLLQPFLSEKQPWCSVGEVVLIVLSGGKICWLQAVLSVKCQKLKLLMVTHSKHFIHVLCVYVFWFSLSSQAEDKVWQLHIVTVASWQNDICVQRLVISGWNWRNWKLLMVEMKWQPDQKCRCVSDAQMSGTFWAGAF